MENELELLQTLNIVLLVVSPAVIAACFTVFFHTIIGSPQVEHIPFIDENGKEMVNMNVDINDNMIFSAIGDYAASAYIWFENTRFSEIVNPFKVFMCQFCFNFWSSGILALIVILNSSLNWYYFIAIVVFSSFIRTKYVA